MPNIRHFLHMATIHGIRGALKSRLAKYACRRVKALKNAITITLLASY